jgi:hypothetical protein
MAKNLAYNRELDGDADKLGKGRGSRKTAQNLADIAEYDGNLAERLSEQDRKRMAEFEAEMRRRQMIGDAITGQANQGTTANDAAQAAGKTGMNNFKSVFSMMGGGAAGGTGG